MSTLVEGVQQSHDDYQQEEVFLIAQLQGIAWSVVTLLRHRPDGGELPNRLPW